MMVSAKAGIRTPDRACEKINIVTWALPNIGGSLHPGTKEPLEWNEKKQAISRRS